MKRLTHRIRPLSLGIAVFILVVSVTAFGRRPPRPDVVPPHKLPLLRIGDFKYVGAFRLPSREYGPSESQLLAGADGVQSGPEVVVHVVGHAHHQAVAEFAIPELVNSTVLAELKMAGDPVQPFATILDRAGGGNPESIDGIGGMLYVPGSEGGRAADQRVRILRRPGRQYRLDAGRSGRGQPGEVEG